MSMLHSTGKATTPRQANIALGVLFVVALFNYIDRAIVSILQEPLKHDLHLSDAQLGALTGLSFALFYTTLALPVARLADRVLRKGLVAVALTLWSGMTAAAALATSYPMLLFFRVGVAVGEAGCVPATHSLFSDYFPLNRRGTAFALWGLSLPLGTMLGFAGGGWLNEALGWRGAFLAIGLLGVGFAPFVLMLREPPRGQHDPVRAPEAHMPLGQAIRTLWRLKSFRYLAIAGALHAYTQLSFQNWNAPFYTRVHSMPIHEVATYLALLFGVCGGLGTFLGGYLADRLGAHDRRWYGWIPALASLLTIPFALGQYFVADPYVSLAIGTVPAMLTTVYFAVIGATAQSLVPSPMRAFTAAGLVLIVNLFGMGLGPVTTGFVSDVLMAQYGMATDSLRYALSTSLLFAGAAAVMFGVAARYLPAEMPPIQQPPKDSAQPQAAVQPAS